MEGKPTSHSFSILGLYRINFTAALHARAMAKKLETNHVTLLPYLRQLERNKILLSRRVGRNKEYFLNPENSLAKHYLAITEELVAIDYLNSNFLIKKVSDSLATLNLVGSLMLFGSYAKGYSTEASDVDLFYLGGLQPNQKSEIANSGKIYGKEINVKASSIMSFQEGLRTGDTLIREVVESHIILQNPGLFVDLVWRNCFET